MRKVVFSTKVNGRNFVDDFGADIALDFCKTFVQWQQDNKCPKCKEPRLDIYTKGKGIICTNCQYNIKFNIRK